MVFTTFFNSYSVAKHENVDNNATMKKLQKTWDCVGGKSHLVKMRKVDNDDHEKTLF